MPATFKVTSDEAFLIFEPFLAIIKLPLLKLKPLSTICTVSPAAGEAGKVTVNPEDEVSANIKAPLCTVSDAVMDRQFAVS